MQWRERCHLAWLDTFQALEFDPALGYQEFGALENYPESQTRWFLRKRLGGDASMSGSR